MQTNDQFPTSVADKQKPKGLRSILSNNKIVMLFSLLLAFALWIWVSIEKSPVVTQTVSSVPVKIEMENSVPAQLNLQMFGNTDYTVDVTVSGRRFIVSTLTADDITVTAQTNYVDSSGNKSLQLKAVAAQSGKDFEIVGLSQNYIDVYFDTYKEAEFAIEPHIVAPDGKTVVDGCMLGNILFSETSVVVSGPSTEVNKVTGVLAETSVSAPLSATTTVQPEIKLQSDAGETLSNVSLDVGDTPITMTMPVLKVVTLPTTVNFKNAPTWYLNNAVPVTVSPANVRAAVPVEQVDEIKSIPVGTVDFAELDRGYNVFNFKASDVTDYMIMDNTLRFKANVNMTGTIMATFTVPAQNISITAQKDGFRSELLGGAIENVRVVGTQEDIAALTNEMLFASVDLTDADLSAGEQSVRVRIEIKGNTAAWASGTYTVRIRSTAQ